MVIIVIFDDYWCYLIFRLVIEINCRFYLSFIYKLLTSICIGYRLMNLGSCLFRRSTDLAWRYEGCMGLSII